MLLRPTQFVFMLLLLCSVQSGEDYIRQLTVAAPAHSLLTAQGAPRSQQPGPRRTPQAAPLRASVPTGVCALAAAPAFPAMTSPASSAAAIAYRTGQLRA